MKKKGVKKDGYVRYYDIGDYLSRTDKLNTISHFESIKNIPWKYLTPNDNNDWLNQRNPNFMNFIALEERKSKCIFRQLFIWIINKSRCMGIQLFWRQGKRKC